MCLWSITFLTRHSSTRVRVRVIVWKCEIDVVILAQRQSTPVQLEVMYELKLRDTGTTSR